MIGWDWRWLGWESRLGGMGITGITAGCGGDHGIHGGLAEGMLRAICGFHEVFERSDRKESKPHVYNRNFQRLRHKHAQKR